MKNQLNDNLIKSYIENSYGFGNYKGRYWFIGMEPGGGNSIEEIARRISVWKKLGGIELEDVAEFHRKLGMPEFFQEPVKLQPTWNRLIRILLSAEGSDVTTDMVRRYQKEKLGRMDGENCIIELLPLSSPSTSQWILSELSDLDILKDRETYRQSCIPWRKQHIQERIIEYCPTTVIFYGMVYRDYWMDISQVQFKMMSDGFFIGQNDKTIFVIVRHPVSKGITNEYFQRIGKEIAVRNSLNLQK